MSLREEIYKIIRHSFPDNNPNTIAFVSRKINNEIERRIDLTQLPQYQDGIYTKSEVNNIVQQTVALIKEILK